MMSSLLGSVVHAVARMPSPCDHVLQMSSLFFLLALLTHVSASTPHSTSESECAEEVVGLEIKEVLSVLHNDPPPNGHSSGLPSYHSALGGH